MMQESHKLDLVSTLHDEQVTTISQTSSMSDGILVRSVEQGAKVFQKIKKLLTDVGPDHMSHL